MSLMEDTILAALIGFGGLLASQFFVHWRWKQSQDERDEKLKNSLRETREVERETDRRAIEMARSAIVEDATRMVDRYEADASAANERWQQCEVEHQRTREDLQRVAGSLEELRARVTESERTFGLRELEREKDRVIKHQALTALAVSEVAMSTTQKLAPNCECGAVAPIRDLLDSWTPTYSEIVQENIMGLHAWAEIHANRYQENGEPV